MAKRTPSPADITQVESDLWNTIRALEAIGRSAADIATATNGNINAHAEGIAGIAAVTVAQIRSIQIVLGGEE
ncbi:hypothetical protein [Devosia sp. 2618]|uniref:hypothetical protein n=1 Tax=Devosia sp. 2618 TaxID=3156454 RepID=UPI003391D21B